jgi:hypothetical protein
VSYDNRNRFTLGRNRNPQSDRSPPYTGKIDIEGVGYWLNGWVQTNQQTGERFFSGTVKRQGETQRDTDSYKKLTGDSDDIPF